MTMTAFVNSVHIRMNVPVMQEMKMMRKSENDFFTRQRKKLSVEIGVRVALLVFIVAAILFSIVVLVKYGNKPLDEVPLWVVWLLKG